MTQRYTSVAIALHWLLAIAMLGMVFFGLWMEGLREQLNDPERASLELFQQVQAAFNWHKTVGIAILVLSLFRLFWRLTHKVPPLPDKMKGWEKAAARTTHVLFYALMIGLPIGGYVAASSFGDTFPILAFNNPDLALPKLPVPQTEEFQQMTGQAHGLGGRVVLLLTLLHVGAALKHHFLDRDDTLARMLPFLKR
jgi:cytochrome b561